MNIITQYYGLKRELYVIFLTRLIVALGALVSPMFVLLLSVKLGYTPTTISYIFAASTAVSIPASLIGGRLADRYSRKQIIIGFELTVVGLYVVAALLPLGFLTVICVMLAGFFSSIQYPATTALTADFSRPQERMRAFSLGYLGFNLGFIIAPTVAGFLFQDYLSLIFAFNAFAIFLSVIIIYFFIHERNSYRYHPTDSREEVNEYETEQQHESVVSILSHRRIVLLVILGSYLTGLVYSVVGFLAPLQLEARLADQGSVYYGVLTSVNAATVIVVTPLISLLVKKMTDLRKMMLALSLMVSSLLLFGFSSWVGFYFIAMIVYTLGEVFNTLGYMPYLTKRIPASHRGRIMGLVGVISTILAVVSNLLVGWVLEHYGFVTSWVLYVIIGSIGFICYLLAEPRDRQQFRSLYASSRQNDIPMDL